MSNKSLNKINSPKYSYELRTNYGNWESNLFFLESTNVLMKDQKILEIGSGLGTMVKHLLDQGHNIQGIDINAEVLEKGRELHGNLPITLVHSEMLPFEDNTFDVVISFDLFEHVKDSDNHLREISRVLKQKGFYLLKTPNKYTNTIFEIIRYKSFTSWREDHCSLHSYKSLVNRFNKNGYKIEFYDIPLVNEFFIEKLQRYLGKIGLFLLKIYNPDKLPINLKTNFYVKAQKI